MWSHVVHECPRTPLTGEEVGGHKKHPTHLQDGKLRGTNLSVKTDKPIAGQKYYNPDTLAHLISCSNKSMVIIKGIKTTVIINMGLRSEHLWRDCAQNFGWLFFLWGLLHLEMTRGISITYKGYVEAILSIPNLPHYNEYLLLLLISDNKYGERVPVWQGTFVMTMEE